MQITLVVSVEILRIESDKTLINSLTCFTASMMGYPLFFLLILSVLMAIFHLLTPRAAVSSLPAYSYIKEILLNVIKILATGAG